MEDITFIIPGVFHEVESFPGIFHTEMTIGFIRAKVSNRTLTNPAVFRATLTDVLTRWVHYTMAGKLTWKGFEKGFIFGDLSVWQAHPTLTEALALVGIHDLQVDIGRSVDPAVWAVDDVLVRYL